MSKKRYDPPSFTKENTKRGSQLLESWLGTTLRIGYDIPNELIAEMARLALRVAACPIGTPMRVPGYEPKEHSCPECGSVTEDDGCPTCEPPCPNAGDPENA